jgi:hypothetical protein
VKTSAGDNPGIVSSPQSFSIGPLLVIQPPTPVQPLADTFPHKRPMFTVGNATHTGPEATLTYRFDIATDSTFTNVVTSGTVPEGTGQTSFTATADLTPGTSYVWRAKASDTAKAVTSDYSRAQFFTTVFPEDGTFRYDLTLHMVSAAQCEWSGVGGGWPVPPLLIADFKVDDGLVVSGDHLRYGPLPGYCCIGDGLVLNIDRSGNQLSGIMSGEVTPLFVFDLTLAFFAPNILTGTADSPTGRFTGTISGGFNQHSGGLGSTGCASVFSFMLTPHP